MTGSLDTCIEQFAAAPLFQYVGEPISDDRVQHVRSWKAAIRPRLSGRSSEIYDCIMNRICRFARTTRGEDWFNAEWSNLVDEGKVSNVAATRLGQYAGRLRFQGLAPPGYSLSPLRGWR